MKPKAERMMSFSHGQFFVCDASVRLPGCGWTPQHFAQGFARRPSNVCIRTLLEFGTAAVRVHCGPYSRQPGHKRVIEVPLRVATGRVVVAGPEEYPNPPPVEVEGGDYRLTAAQAIVDERQEEVDIYLERLAKPLFGSKVVVADVDLTPSAQLLEDADVG